MLKLAAGPQIVPVYGTDFRSTPVFFLQDDHDYFDNDEAFDEIVTFPPSGFNSSSRARRSACITRNSCRIPHVRRTPVGFGRRSRRRRFRKLGHAALRPAG